MVGLNVSPVKKMWINGKQINKILIHQRPLKEAVVKRYKAETRFQKLRAAATPYYAVEEDHRAPGYFRGVHAVPYGPVHRAL